MPRKAISKAALQPVLMMRLPAPRAGRWSAAYLPWLIGGAALLALIYFDLGPSLAFNDDWEYAWSARQLMAGHGLRVFPGPQKPLALVQVVWSALFTLGHPDERFLRLSIVPFVALAVICSYRLARRLGAGPFWSGVAGMTLLTTPLFLANATSFMSDTAYVALLMAVALAGVRWVETGKGRLACVVCAALCPLQRQLGVLIPLAVTVALLLARRERKVARNEWWWLLALWGGVAVAAIFPAAARLSPPGLVTSIVGPTGAGHSLLPILFLPPMLGLCLLPFAAALTLAPGASRQPVLFGVAAAASAAVSTASLLLPGPRMIFPGNVWTRAGFAAGLDGDKGVFFPDPVFVAIELAALTTFTVLVVLRRRHWTLSNLKARGAFLVALAGMQLLPLSLLRTHPFDRYYLAVAAPLVPLVAAWAGGVLWARPARAWAVLVMAGGLALYGAGQQDYEAWQAARDVAARLAYRTAAPAEVQAGYEANAVYAEIPYYEQTGQLLAPELAADGGFAAHGPAAPRLRLLYGRPDDPRPGVDYRSLHSGRIVIAAQ